MCNFCKRYFRYFLFFSKKFSFNTNFIYSSIFSNNFLFFVTKFFPILLFLLILVNGCRARIVILIIWYICVSWQNDIISMNYIVYRLLRLWRTYEVYFVISVSNWFQRWNHLRHWNKSFVQTWHFLSHWMFILGPRLSSTSFYRDMSGLLQQDGVPICDSNHWLY